MLRIIAIVAMLASSALAQPGGGVRELADRLRDAETVPEALGALADYERGTPVRAGSYLVARQIVRGDTDLILIGDSQSMYTQFRGVAGIAQHFAPESGWCGRGWSGSNDMDASCGCRFLGPATGATSNSVPMETDTSDSEAASHFSPRAYFESTFTQDLSNTTRIWSLRSALDANLYQGGDPFLGKRVKMWAIHRASNATERMAGGGYRLGTFVDNVQISTFGAVTMGTGGGLEKSAAVTLAAGQYTASLTESLELRAVPLAGVVETGKKLQFAGGVMHNVNGDDSRAGGLVLTAAARSGQDLTETNALVSQAVWQDFIAAVTTGADRTVFMIMFGHNTEAGVFADELETLMDRLDAATLAETGKAPWYMPVAPWDFDAGGHEMTEQRALDMLAISGSGTEHGEVLTISLYHAFGAATPPGFTNLHPQSDADLATAYGRLWQELYAASRPGTRSRRRGRSRMRAA